MGGVLSRGNGDGWEDGGYYEKEPLCVMEGCTVTAWDGEGLDRSVGQDV
jgi:hypothetical protein